MQTLFVTGAGGFIGSHLVREVTRRGLRCKALVRAGSTRKLALPEEVELIEGVIEDSTSYRAALEGCDTVVHLAGLTHSLRAAALYEINGAACATLADACLSMNQPPRLVHVSSLAAAGPPLPGTTLRTERDPSRPISRYGRSKRQGELALADRADRLPITILRPGMVYGPGDPKLAEMIRLIYRWRLHVVVGFRTPPLSLIHIDDFVCLILTAAERGEILRAAGQDSSVGYYIACDDSEFPNYWALGQRIAGALNRSVLVWPLWRWVAICVGFAAQTAARFRGQPSFLNVDKIREAAAHSWAASGQKAREQLGFSPARRLDASLGDTARWYVENGWV